VPSDADLQQAKTAKERSTLSNHRHFFTKAGTNGSCSESILPICINLAILPWPIQRLPGWTNFNHTLISDPKQNGTRAENPQLVSFRLPRKMGPVNVTFLDA
jgi:hypothetical protein